jgi:sporulation protein YabP
MAELQNNRATAKKHTLEMAERKTLTVCGVQDVISFDDSCILLSTVCGVMSVDGAEMRIVSLDLESGKVEISGSVNGIIYPESAAKVGLFRKRQK